MKLMLELATFLHFVIIFSPIDSFVQLLLHLFDSNYASFNCHIRESTLSMFLDYFDAANDSGP